jgi:cell division protein FtsN
MSDPRPTPPRISEPKNSNTMYYVIGGLVVVAIAAYLYNSSAMDKSSSPATSQAPATTQTEPAVPATPAEPVNPAGND